MRHIRITHVPSGEVLAEGPVGLFGITPFEGNYYIRQRYLRTSGFKVSWLPGFCVYKFLYVYLDFVPKAGAKERFLGWLYWLPNPLLPFIAFRTAVPGASDALRFDDIEAA
ncbi:MAG: hypothetical protein ACTSYE_00935 [Alphaproteobacteria bacterium]